MLLLSALLGCSGHTQHSQTNTVDLLANYPLAQATALQDVAEVRYIPLQTDSLFLCDGDNGVVFINDSLIIFFNHINKDFLIFDGDGKALSRFNHYGNGPEDYAYPFNIFFDPVNSELYYVEYYKVKVYNLKGKFLRDLNRYSEIFEDMSYFRLVNFSDSSLLFYVSNPQKQKVIEISKKDGGKIKEREFPAFQPDKLPDYLVSDEGDKSLIMYYGANFCCPYDFLYYNSNKVYFNILASDTVILLINDSLDFEPIIVRKQGLFDAKAIVMYETETPRHYFFRLLRQTSENASFPLMLDRQTGEISEQNFYNADDLNQKRILFGLCYGDIKMAGECHYALLQPFKLHEALENGKLIGELQQVAGIVGEDDNPVVMRLKFR
jgi:hypothetical protein